MDIRKYVENYRFEFDGGGSYVPSEHEIAMLEDAINGFIGPMLESHARIAEEFCEQGRDGYQIGKAIRASVS